MTTLLRIDSSLRMDGSYSRELTQDYQDQWLNQNPDGKVIHRCLMANPIPHLTQADYEGFFNQLGESDSLSDELIQEILLADEIVIGSPLYNMSISSTLKAYIDHIVRLNATFDWIDGAMIGRLQGKKLTLCISRGSCEPESGYKIDHSTEYLKAVFGSVGIFNVNCIAYIKTASDQPELVRNY
ncbi:FMN-dependent NADH-azoreductase [Vibrio nigripulchritudo]|uniref:FMN-dependent NADH-azoreductase n=1 Tax=Vibrio nigripulchritudo TaxID=28173 RepID=UPI0005FA2C62|nr:NAD(P)H-dependent oxidoreductase [Vibrio nigripulchritudo]